MGKPLGKDISKMTQEEINALMAEWRSRRDGNGRKGYRTPDSQKIFTNDFKDDSKKWTPGTLKKTANEHVKCIFICARELYKRKNAQAKSDIFYIGFLSDSNRYSFEEFRDVAPPQAKDGDSPIKHRVKKYVSIFGNKNIDKNTEITLCLNDFNEHSRLMYTMVDFMVRLTMAKITRIEHPRIIKKLINEYKLFGNTGSVICKNCKNYKRETINRVFRSIYDFAAENSICPWITKEHREEVIAFSNHMRHSRIIVELGLLYTLLIRFNYLQYKKKRSKA